MLISSQFDNRNLVSCFNAFSFAQIKSIVSIYVSDNTGLKAPFLYKSWPMCLKKKLQNLWKRYTNSFAYIAENIWIRFQIHLFTKYIFLNSCIIWQITSHKIFAFFRINILSVISYVNMIPLISFSFERKQILIYTSTKVFAGI